MQSPWAYAELGYGLQAGRLALEPYVNLAHVVLSTDGLTEKGGAAALEVRSQTTEMTFSTLGVHLGLDAGPARLQGGLGWRHAMGNETPDAKLAFIGGDTFRIAGTPLAKNTAVADVGLSFTVAPNATAGVSYSGQFGNGVSEHAVHGVLQVRF